MKSNVIKFLSNSLKIGNDDMQLLVSAIDKNGWDENKWLNDEVVMSVLDKIPFDMCPVLIYRGIIKLMDR